VEPKDHWNKIDIVLKPLGGLLTALAVGMVGYYGSATINSSQARDTDVRLYAQLMSQREEAETSLRKDMFNSIIGTFLKTKPSGYDFEQQVLNLELLAYNFHEALDLAPLFKDVYVKIRDSKDLHAEEYMKRLERVAGEVKLKQIAALEESGGKLDATIDLDELNQKLEGMTIIDGTILPQSSQTDPDPALRATRFKLQAISGDKKKREIRVLLEVRTNKQDADSSSPDDAISSIFNISPFDFPMIDNVRLPHGHRCAIVVRKFGDPNVEITLVYFPGSRASLKEKPFYDEAMHDLLYTRSLIDKEKSDLRRAH
jgi:hypothetical protein